MSTRLVFVTLLFAVLAGSCAPPQPETRPARPFVVSKDVGPLLKEAQAMIAANNYEGAMAKLDQAEAVKVTADDENVISQMRHFITVKSSQPSQP